MPKKQNKPMPDLYRIKYWPKGHKEIVRFGEVNKYHPQAEEEWEKGNLVVCDALTGKPWLVPVSEMDYEKQDFSWNKTDPETGFCIDTEFDRYLNDEYKAHSERDKAAGEGLKVHRMFHMGVADGSAHYVITKVNKKTCRIEWRNFGADNYYHDVFHGGGTFPKDIIEDQIRRQDSFKKLFGRGKKAA